MGYSLLGDIGTGEATVAGPQSAAASSLSCSGRFLDCDSSDQLLGRLAARLPSTTHGGGTANQPVGSSPSRSARLAICDRGGDFFSRLESRWGGRLFLARAT